MATIYDVARAAGVDPSTVSYALSGKGTISKETRAKILRLAEDLGYRPNLVARSLIMQHTHTIGLVLPTISNPFYGEVAQAVERRAQRAGYRVFVANTDGDERLGDELLEDLAARQVDGVIAMSGGLSLSCIVACSNAGLPVVSCMWNEQDLSAPAPVDIDFVAGGRIAAHHLLDLGHRRIGLIAEGTAGATPRHHLRMRGFHDALVDAGVTPEDTLTRLGDSSVESGKVAALDLLSLPDPPTAIFATNDLMALGILAAAWKLNLRVPQDLSIVGFDDIVPAAYVTPPLTTIRIDRTAFMDAATDYLLDMIAGRPVAPPPIHVPTLAVRASTGGVPGARRRKPQTRTRAR